MPTMTRKQAVLECIRAYEREGLINENDEMKKGDAAKFHRKYLMHKFRTDFYLALAIMSKKNLIFRANETGKPLYVVFKPGKLDLILEGNELYLAKAENKYVVSQNVAFREQKEVNPYRCLACNNIFQSTQALQQHKQDKVHIVAALRKQASQMNFSEKTSEVCAEIVQGSGNGSESVFKMELKFEITLSIVNNTDNNIVIDNIEHVNTELQSMMQVVFAPGTIVKPRASYHVQLLLKFTSMRSYELPLSIIYTDTDGLCFGFNKHLVFIITSGEYSDLKPTTPFKRLNPIVSDLDETIIPGEKPEFQVSFKFAIKLKPYILSPVDIKIFNSGLKECDTDRLSSIRLNEIKQLLDVKDPMHCLTENNYCKMLDLLLYLEEHQMQIDIRKYNMATDRLKHDRNDLYMLEVPELSENRPSLLVGDSVYVKSPDAKMKYEGIVHEKYMDKVKLGFSKKFSNIYVAKTKFNVSFSYNRTTLKLEHQAAFLADNCASYFFPKTVVLSSALDDIVLNCHNRDISKNPEQLQAVREIVRGSVCNVPYLIFGPPGTGKTMTVVEAVLQVYKLNANVRILVCAPSNAAANLLCTRLLKFRKFSEKELLRYVSYSCNIADISEVMLKYCNIVNRVVSHPTVTSLREFRLVITTLTTAGRLYNGGVGHDHFSYVFIDEAGHATETETLIPITAVLVGTKKVRGRVILAGDPEQLGPIIHSSVAQRYGFGISMLERLMKQHSIYKRDASGTYDNRVLTKLLHNYRSHPEIIAVSNKEFYEGELISVGNDFTHIALGHDVLPNPSIPMVFHSVLGHDQRESTSPSFFNIQEIDTVLGYVQKLIGSKMKGYLVKASDIAIITPYRKQVQKLKQAISKSNYDGIEVGTIEKLQGQERLIVIITTVRSLPEHVKHDVKYRLGFLKNPKRMNVALTRAKALLIVIGNPNLLKYDECWRKYIQRCVDNNATAGAEFSLEIDEGVDQLLAGFTNMNIEEGTSVNLDFGRGNQ